MKNFLLQDQHIFPGFLFCFALPFSSIFSSVPPQKVKTDSYSQRETCSLGVRHVSVTDGPCVHCVVACKSFID